MKRFTLLSKGEHPGVSTLKVFTRFSVLSLFTLFSIFSATNSLAQCSLTANYSQGGCIENGTNDYFTVEVSAVNPSPSATQYEVVINANT